MPPINQYLNWLEIEIKQRSHLIPFRDCQTLYFGGGTPSLLSADQLSRIISMLKAEGFDWKSDAEWTIEMNPGTVALSRVQEYMQIGFNRFSIGAQSFNEAHLKSCFREHSVQDTHDLLMFLSQKNCNFSADLLFALPHQSLEELDQDIKTLLGYYPSHISPYCLTVPSGHRMSFNRPKDEEQVEMFRLIHESLTQKKLFRYEISNYSQLGYESRHNKLYWEDQSFWGIGLSAHSYFPTASKWGLRINQATSLKSYEKEICSSLSSFLDLPLARQEELSFRSSLNEFCYMSLRTTKGLSLSALEKKFGLSARHLVAKKIKLVSQFVEEFEGAYRLNDEGVLLSNRVFLDLYISSEELNPGVIREAP